MLKSVFCGAVAPRAFVSVSSSAPFHRSRKLVRAALLGSTALVAASLATTGAMAQTTPTGGTVVDNTGSGGGYQLTNSTALTVNNVTINNTTGSPSVHGINWNSTTFSGSGRGFTLSGTNSISSTSGSAINYASTGGENMGFGLHGDQTITGLSGIVLNSGGAIFHGGAGSLNLTAQTPGQGVGLDFNANFCICDTSFTGPISATGFATGIDLTTTGSINFTTGAGGAITGAVTGINASAASGLTLAIGSSISASGTGVSAVNTGASPVSVTTNAAISAGGAAIYSSSGGTGNLVTLNADATGSGLAAVHTVGQGYTVNVHAGATVTGSGTNSRTLIMQSGDGVVINDGTIRNLSGDANSAIQFAQAGTVTNIGTISYVGNQLGAIYANTGLSVTNSGTISATGAQQVAIYSSGNGAFATSVTNQASGSIIGSIGLFNRGTGINTLDLQAGSSTGGVRSFSGGATTANVAGTLTGAYDAVNGAGATTLTLASTGSMTSATFGAANDTFTYQGGTFSGVINAGTGTDSFTSSLGLGNAATIDQANLTGFESFTQQSGDLTLNGARTSGSAWTVAGGSLTLAGSLSGLNATHVNVNGAAAAFNNADGASVTGGNYMGVRVSGAGATVSNLGSITNSGTGADGTVGAAVYVSTTSGTTTINNGSLTDTGAGSLIQGQNAGVRHQGGADTLAVNNYGQIIGNLYNGIENSAGALTVANFAGGLIRGHWNGIAGGNTIDITNAGVISSTHASGQGILSNGSILTLENQSGGQISGSAAGVAAIRGSIVNDGSITTTGTTADAAGIWTSFGGSITNNASGVISGGHWGIRNTAGALTVNNAGLIDGGQNDGITSHGVLTLTNSGTLSSSTFSGVAFVAGGSVTNSGTITGGGDATWGYGIQNASGSGLLTITNQSGGVISAGAGSILLSGAGATIIDLQAGSTTTGQIASISSGAITTTIAGALNGAYNAASGTGVDNLTLASTGSMTSASLGAGNDTVTYQGGAFSGLIDAGAGTDSFTSNLGAGTGSLNLANVGAFESIIHQSGDLTLTGASASAAAEIHAGQGGPSGALIFNGVSGLTGDIFVNGALLRAETAAAFGTGTIHLINPTISYGATGTYANNISLDVQSPATADPSTLRTDAGVTATLTGAITQGTGVGVDPVQPLVIDGLGTIVLTNSANSWAGDTTINAGATLQGAANTISGGAIVNNGDLVFNQTADGTSSLAISGTGELTLTGGAVLTLSGANTWSGATWINDGALNVAGGSAIGDASAVTVAGGASLQLADDETIGSLAGAGDVFVGANTLSVGADGNSTVFSGVISDSEPLTFVGSWRVSDGPTFYPAAPLYSGVTAAAFLFGGTAADYRISTVSNQVADINDSAWMDGYGQPWAMFADDYLVDNGEPGYTYPDYSAYVRDHVNYTYVNYAFTGGEILGGGLTKVGAGTLTLTGANTYTGLTLVTGGVLELVNGAAIADVGTVQVDAGGTLAVTTSETIANLTGDGAAILGSGATLTLGAATGQYDGDVSGLGTFSVAGGALSVGGAFTNAGGLQFLNGTSGVITSTGSVTTSGGWAVRMLGDGGSLTNAGAVSGGFGAGTDIGVLVDGEDALVTNLAGGEIAGSRAVQFNGNGGTLTNAGVITGGTTAGGIGFVSGGAGTLVDNLLGGEISGYVGVQLNGTAAGSQITNAGEISGVFAISAAVDLDLTNSGSISASVTNFNNSGIYTAADGVIDNSGSITSGTNAIYTQGVGSVTNSGLIQGGGAASTIRLVGVGSSVTNLVGGQITTTGTGIGVYLDGANASVVNAGSISGGNAVYLVQGGTVTNTGTLTSTVGSGVVFQAAGSVDNQTSGSIEGATNGVIYVAGAASIANAGSITGLNGAGVRLHAGGTVTNAAVGEITGTGHAIFVQGGALNLVNQGDLVGTSGVAIVTSGAFDNIIDLQAGSSTSGSVTTDTGADTLTVAGLLSGAVSLGGGADSFTLLGGGSVTGLIDGGADTDAFVSDLGVGSASLSLNNLANFESYAHQSGSLTLTGSRTGGVGWSIWGGDLTLDGTLSVDLGHGLMAMDTATINIADGATLTGNQNGVQGDLGVSITLNNSGTITSNNVLGGGGVRLNAASTINNIGGVIDGGLHRGISLSGAGHVINNDSTSTIRGDRAIETDGAGTTIVNAGLIEGVGDIGVAFFAADAVVTNLSTGQITGVNQGVYASAGLTLVNDGLVSGGRHGLLASGSAAHVTNMATGVMRGGVYNGVYAGGDGTTVANAGLMEGGNAAVYLDGANTVIDNSGVIRVTGTTAPTVISGVYVSGAGASITNSGTIESTLTDGRGIFLAGGGGSIDNQSGGVISGNGDGAAILLTGADYVLNLAAGSTVNGLIDASTTTGLNVVDVAGVLNGAYVGGSGVDDVTLIGGGVFGGAILGADGVDTLTLSGVGDGALDMGLIDGFETRTMDGTGTWSLSGTDVQNLTWTINSGVLSASGGSAIHNGASVVVNAAGELNLADDEAIDSLTGDGAVTLGANTLMVGAAGGSSQFDGVISGTGGMAQVGPGTLILTGANTYTGWTSVAAGVLQLGAGGVLADASSLSIADAAVFDLQAFDETVALAVIDGTVSGTGTLTAAQYELTGATVDANLGAGTLINVSGVSTLNGTSAAGLISLAGGTLVLGGDERLSDSATLSVDDGATFDMAGFDEEIGSLWGEGEVELGGGSLTFGGADSGFMGTLSGLGAVNHTAGLFTLLGDHTVSSINNSGGELRFLGSTTGDVTVSGGMLTGQADIGGDLVVSSGGVLSPGLAGVNNGIGYFSTGSLSLSGGTLAIDLLGASGGYLVDQVLVNGTANLTGGTLATNFIGPVTDFNFTTTYVVVAADTLIGRFDNGGEFTADPTKDGLYWRVRYDLVADAAVIELRQMVDFQIGEKGTLNQNAVGGALNGGQLEADDDWAAILGQLAPLEGDALNDALNSISGEGLANASTSALNAGDRFLEAIRQGSGANVGGGDDTLAFGSQLMLSSDGFSGRLAGQDNINLNAVPGAGSGDGARGFWVGAYAGESDLEGRAGQSDVTTDLTGLAGGFNVAVGDLTLGSAIGVSDLKAHVDARASEYEMSLTHTAVYGRYDDGVWFGDLSLMGYSGEMDANRTVTVGAGVAQTAGNTTLAGHSISASAGRRFQLAPATQLSVGGVASASSVDIDAYTETGAGGLSLEVASQRREWQTLTVDARLARDYNLGGGQMRAYVGLGAMGTQGDLRALADMRFSGAAAGFGGFVVEGAETPPVAGIVDFGAEYEADGGWTAAIGYRGVFADRLTDHRIGARVAISW